jgi:hypothetical protein
MLIHVEIAARVHVQVKRAVARDEFEHVIEKTNSRGNARFSAPLQI